MRVWLLTLALIAALLAAVAGGAVLAWPRASVGPDGEALARVVLPGFAGHVAAVAVYSAGGRSVPVQLRQGRLWPLHTLASGERLAVVLTVRRPGWAGWLVGHSEQHRFAIETPTAHLLGRWLEVKTGAPINATFDTPVRLVLFSGAPSRRLASPQAVVPVGAVAGGSHGAGSVEVAAAARSWERLPVPVRLSWFPARPYPQLLAEPKPGTELAPGRPLVLTFSRPVREVLGTSRPRLRPATPGSWRLLDAHTIAFQASGFGFAMGASVHVQLPRAAHLAGQSGAKTTTVFGWQVPEGSTVRLQQLLAGLGYLPLSWRPNAEPAPSSTELELAAALKPPPGRFSWRYPNTPAELRALWDPGQPNDITRGAVMMFEHDHRLAVDGIPGQRVWNQLLTDTLAGKTKGDGYAYVYVHRSLPQSLNLWHNGRVILKSPGNTGVPAAPTQLGTFPVFEHIPTGTMSGINPDGSHYNDPGIRYISYFHGGDAIHAFNRASFGTPQSLGCVELPLPAATKVWPYTPIGTLVTIEN